MYYGNVSKQAIKRAKQNAETNSYKLKHAQIRSKVVQELLIKVLIRHLVKYFLVVVEIEILLIAHGAA